MEGKRAAAGNSGLRVRFLEHVIVRGNSHPIDWLVGFGCQETVGALQAFFHAECDLETARARLIDELHSTVARLEPPFRSMAIELRRRLKVDLGPVELASDLGARLGAELQAGIGDWNRIAAEHASTHAVAELAFRREFGAVGARIRDILSRPLVREGLLLSSRDLYASVARYVADSPTRETKRGKSQRQFERSFTEHLSRSCAKMTPRGLLSGQGIGRWSPTTSGPLIAVVPERRTTTAAPSGRRTILGLDTSRIVARVLSGIPEVRSEVVPRPNPTLYREDGKIYFIKDLGTPSESLLRLAAQDVIDRFLERAEGRRLTARALLSEVHVALERDHDLEDLSKFYESLCAKQLLIGDLEIPYEERNGLAYLIRWLDTLPASAKPPRALEIRELLGEIDRHLKAVDLAPVGSESSAIAYRHILASLSRISPEFEGRGEADVLIVESLPEPRGIEIGDAIRGELLHAIEISHRMTVTAFQAGLVSNASSLARDLVSEKDVAAGEFPLVRLIHPGQRRESSIPALEKRPGENSVDTFVSQFRNWVKKCEEATGDRVHELDLEADGFLAELPPKPTAPGIGTSMIEFQIAASGTDAIDKGDYLLLLEGMRNNFSSNFLRQVELHPDPRILAELDRHGEWLRNRFYQGKVWADVLTRANGRVDTALWQGQIHSHCIETSGVRSARPVEQIVPVREIWVKETKNSGSEVVWRRPSGDVPLHPAFTSPKGIGHLSDLELFLRLVGWEPSIVLSRWLGALLRVSNHIPRLKIGRVVLSREFWSFPRAELSEHVDADLWRSFVKWNRWREKAGVPRWIFVENGELSPFYVDFSNPFTIEVFNQFVQNTESAVRITEMYPDPDHCWRRAASGEGSLTTQFVGGFEWECEG